MYNLLVAAYPASPISLVVTQGEDAQEVDRAQCFYIGIIDSVRDMLGRYDINDITVYGPSTYVAHVAKGLTMGFPDKNINLAFAGKEN